MLCLVLLKCFTFKNHFVWLVCKNRIQWTCRRYIRIYRVNSYWSGVSLNIEKQIAQLTNFGDFKGIYIYSMSIDWNVPWIRYKTQCYLCGDEAAPVVTLVADPPYNGYPRRGVPHAIGEQRVRRHLDVEGVGVAQPPVVTTSSAGRFRLTPVFDAICE